MALVVKDRIKETSSTTGQGTLTLGGAVDSFRTFADVGDGNTTYYAIVDGNNFEVGLGTYTASGTTLSRDTVFQTSAGNTTKISCTGNQEVFVTQPADKAVFEDASGVANAIGFRGNIHPNNGATTNYLSLKDSNELNFFNSSNSSIKLYINYEGGDVDLAQSAIVATNGGATKVTNNLLVGTDVGSYNSNDFKVFVSNADQGTTLCLYDDSGAYHSALIKYDTNILSFGLNNANSANTLLTSSAINIGSDGVGIGITPGSARGGYTDLLIAQGGESSAQPQIELYNSSASWAINNDALNSNQMGFHYNNGSSWSQRLALTSGNAVFAGGITFSADSHILSNNNSRNFQFVSGGSGSDVGIYLKDAGSNAFVQLYGYGSGYGFLDGAWANWDLKKERGGAMDLYGSDAMIRLVSTGNNARGIEFIQGAAGSTPASGQTKKAAITWNEGNANLEIKNFRNDQNAINSYANIDFFTGGSNATHPNNNPDRRLRITDDGVVAIGEADIVYPVAPGSGVIKNDRKLQVFGNANAYPMCLDSQDTDYALSFARQGTDEWWIKASSTDFQIHQNGVGDHLRIDSNGCVNITPSTGNGANDAALYVNGPNGNDWGCIINKASGDYGIDLRGSSGSYAFRLLTSSVEKIRFAWDGTSYFQNNVYAARYYDISNSNYYLDPSSTSVINQFDSLGVGTARSGTTGEIRATNNITAYYSDKRLKDFHGKIENAVDKVKTINGYYYSENEKAKEFGYERQDKIQVGVSAQEVEKVLPELVSLAPFDIGEDQKSKSGEDYKTVDYARMIPLLIEAIKEQQIQIDELKEKLANGN